MNMPFFINTRTDMKTTRYALLLIIFTAFIGGPAYPETNMDFFFKLDSQYKDVIIKDVRSADTFILEEKKIGEKPELIRLIGLRAPEAPKRKKEDRKRDEFGFVIKEPVSPLTPIETKAMDYVVELVEGQHVRLEFDVEKINDKFETMAYVFLLDEGTFVNAEILRQGYADLRIRPPNTKYADQLRAAYKEAHSEKRGLRGQ